MDHDVYNTWCYFLMYLARRTPGPKLQKWVQWAPIPCATRDLCIVLQGDLFVVPFVSIFARTSRTNYRAIILSIFKSLWKHVKTVFEFMVHRWIMMFIILDVIFWCILRVGPPGPNSRNEYNGPLYHAPQGICASCCKGICLWFLLCQYLPEHPGLTIVP